jgi:hypothetical protein
MTKAHNPTPEERDERLSLYGMDPEQVIEAVLRTDPQLPEAPSPTGKRKGASAK